MLREVETPTRQQPLLVGDGVVAREPTGVDFAVSLRSVFEEDLRLKNMLLYRVDGTLAGDSVSVAFTPFLLMAPDTTYFNPTLTYPTD